MDTVSFLGVRCGRGVTLTPHPLLVPRSKVECTLPKGLRGLWKGETYLSEYIKWISRDVFCVFGYANVGRLKVKFFLRVRKCRNTHTFSFVCLENVRLKGMWLMGHQTCCSFLPTVCVGNSFSFDKCLASYAGDARRTCVGLCVKCTFFFYAIVTKFKVARQSVQHCWSCFMRTDGQNYFNGLFTAMWTRMDEISFAHWILDLQLFQLPRLCFLNSLSSVIPTRRMWELLRRERRCQLK